MNDFQLVAMLQTGDSHAYATMVNQHKAIVFNTCLRFLMDREDAEDIAQEVFIQVFQSIHNFRGQAKLSTWIYRIAVTKSLDEIKKRKRKKRFQSDGKVANPEDMANIIVGGHRPDDLLEGREKLSQLRNALGVLPERQKEVYLLSKIDGYANYEIAEMMDMSPLAVDGLLYRARKKAEPVLVGLRNQ